MLHYKLFGDPGVSNKAVRRQLWQPLIIVNRQMVGFLIFNQLGANGCSCSLFLAMEVEHPARISGQTLLVLFKRSPRRSLLTRWRLEDLESCVPDGEATPTVSGWSTGLGRRLWTWTPSNLLKKIGLLKQEHAALLRAFFGCVFHHHMYLLVGQFYL